MFSLCGKCVLTSNTVQCCHETEEETLTGTWVIDDVRLALEKGYWILEIYEYCEYNVTRYDPENREGGLFADNIDTFLKLNSEASGYPNRVQIPADEERYIESFWKSRGEVRQRGNQA